MSKTLTAAQIEAAKEAGFYWHPVHKGLVVRHSSGSWVSVDDMLARFVAILATQQPEPRASASFIAAAIAVIKAARAHVLTDEHIDALDIAIKIQQGMFKVPEPRAEVTDDDKLCAERYRLLKSIPFGAGVPAIYRGIAFSFAVSTGRPGFIRSCRGDEMDAAIDAARAGGA
ncbi:TPA: hypothetical protein ACKE3D_002361 [Burkholderia dolosa]